MVGLGTGDPIRDMYDFQIPHRKPAPVEYPSNTVGPQLEDWEDTDQYI